MPRYIAFLRAINVGGHTIKMAQLRQLFEDMGFSNVETFIASGNVIFDAQITEPAALERRIEAHLEQELGYEVGTYLRTPAEVEAIANYAPISSFEPDVLDAGGNSLYVIFLPASLDDAGRERLRELQTDIDDFYAQGREVYWLCRQTMSKSTISGAHLAKAVDMPITIRNINTIRRLATKYPVRR